MIKEIFRFELRYRKRSPATYFYIIIFLLISILLASTKAINGAGAGGPIMENSPFVISTLFSQISFVMILVISAVMGVPIIRDFENNTASIIYTTPIKKTELLIGRFLGSFVVIIVISMTVFLGVLLGEVMPWKNPDNLLEFNIITYIQAYFNVLLPNIFIASVLFFAIGALSRNMLVVYTQGIIFLLIYLISGTLMVGLENKFAVAMLDPFAISSIKLTISKWSIIEKNTVPLALQSVFFANRIVWLIISILGIIITTRYFRLNSLFESDGKNTLKKERHHDTKFLYQKPKFAVLKTPIATCTKIWELSLFHFKSIVREKAFISISVVLIIFMAVNYIFIKDLYGLSVYPTTYKVIDSIFLFILFFVIVAVYYSGELIWRERQLKFNNIYDSLPITDFASIIGKFLGLNFVFLLMIFGLLIYGVIVQVINGYYKFEFDQYFISLVGQIYMLIICYTALAFFIQAIVNHKFLGYLISVIAILLVDTIPDWGLEHSLFRFAQPEFGTYSDMNTYGHFLKPFLWKELYWLSIAGVIFIASIIFSVRGNELGYIKRMDLARQRFNPSIKVIILGLVLITMISGGFIIYNTTVLNEYLDSDDITLYQANYEQSFVQYKNIPQPKIIDVNLKVELYPKTRNFTITGYYWLKNITHQPIDSVHVQISPQKEIQKESIKFSKPTTLVKKFTEYNYEIYKLAQPLLPGDSIQMIFSSKLETKGFVDNYSNTDIVFNGTFLNNYYFPCIGYNSKLELTDDDIRKELELGSKDRLLQRSDSLGYSRSVIGNDANYINFEILIGTDKNQIAIAPGNLVNEWEENNRKYYHYKMDQPILNFYSITSAKYEVIESKLNDIGLEIYYHKGHEYNLKTMISSMKKSIEYYSTQFSPFQYKQLRIVEFPRYGLFAQSFAQTIPFSEGMGFILKIEDNDINMPFYLTAHEVAHQWWMHQVIEANVKGAGFLSESLAQYSALMVVKNYLGEEQIKKILKHELEKYLKGRSHEAKKEVPLVTCENQDYIYYKKGALAMYALQDYISEDSVNSALRNYISDWAYRTDRYPTSIDLIKHFSEVTPDSLKYILNDLFETITFYDNSVDKIHCLKTTNNEYLVNIDIIANKYRADSLGNETEVSINDWIDIGLYATNDSGIDELIYRKKHFMNNKKNSFSIHVNKEPSKGSIDPLGLLIDKDSDNNIKIISKGF